MHAAKSNLNRPIIALTVAVLVLVLAACASDVAASPTGSPATPTRPPSDPTAVPATLPPYVDFHPVPGQPFTLPLNGSAFLDKNGFRITFLRVVSDNRCPLNVQCITGGAAVVEISVRLAADRPDETSVWSIGPDSREPSKRTFGGFAIELLDVLPVPGGTPGPVQVRLVV